MDSLANRVAARYQLAEEQRDQEVLDAVADHLVDAFLDEFIQNVRIEPAAVEKILAADGISADDVNAATGSPEKTAGVGEWVSALGGFILKKVWHLLTQPFLMLEAFIRSSEFRADVKRSFKRALSHEVRSTKHMLDVAKRLARGEPVKSQEIKTAVAQVVDILSKVILIYVVGPHLAALFARGAVKAILALLSPLDEIAGILLDKPLRMATKRMIDSEVGLLPSGFYTHF